MHRRIDVIQRLLQRSLKVAGLLRRSHSHSLAVHTLHGCILLWRESWLLRLKLVARSRLLHVPTIGSGSHLQRALVILGRISLGGRRAFLLNCHVRIHRSRLSVRALHIHGLLLVSQLTWILLVLIRIVDTPLSATVHHISVRLRRVSILAIHTKKATSPLGILLSRSGCSTLEDTKQVPYSLIG